MAAGLTVAVGIDTVDVARIAAAFTRTGSFPARIFTPDERAYCDTKKTAAPHYAVRFAAKEAVMKTLGVGVGAVDWHDIEIVRAESGEPSLRVTGGAADLATQRGGHTWLVSLAHTATVATAIVHLLS